MRRGAQSGVTLIEVLVAVTLLSLLTVAMLFAMHIGLNTFAKTNDKLMTDRRVGGAQKILAEEIDGIVPVMAPCLGMQLNPDAPPGTGQPFGFFQGQPTVMRLVSDFSLQLGWRGIPQILEFAVVPGEDGRGVRLLVNEIPYTGPPSAGRLCLGYAPDPISGLPAPQFAPVMAGPQSFVLADKLAFCRFSYLTPPQPGQPAVWAATWSTMGWPRGVRVEMAPLDPDGTRLQPIAVTAPIRLLRDPQAAYAD